MTLALAVFTAAGLLLVYAGTVQTRAADAIAELTGLGRLFVGSLVLAAATSMPELATDVSAVRLGAVNLAAGDLFGSSLANMLILVAVGYVSASAPVFRAATPVHALVGTARSLPELVTAVAAIRLGAMDLAVGNLFGSNASTW